VGYAEGSAFFTVKSDLPDGSDIVWELYRIKKLDDSQPLKESICSYPGKVNKGVVTVQLPVRYVRQMKQDTNVYAVHLSPIHNEGGTA
jgi:hypothetical protein